MNKENTTPFDHTGTSKQQGELKFKAGDHVVMINCVEAESYAGHVWECRSNSYIDKAGQEVVFLNCFSGCFMANCLTKTDLPVTKVQQADTSSEGKETVEQAAERLSAENLIPDAISHWYKGGVKHGARWQSQHTDTAIAELKEENERLKGQIHLLQQQKNTVGKWWKTSGESLQKWKEAIEQHLDPTSDEYKKFIEENELD